jgi:hypothetical protein
MRSYLGSINQWSGPSTELLTQPLSGRERGQTRTAGLSGETLLSRRREAPSARTKALFGGYPPHLSFHYSRVTSASRTVRFAYGVAGIILLVVLLEQRRPLLGIEPRDLRQEPE